MKKVKKFIAVFTAALAVGTSGMIVNADELDYAVDEEIIVFSENVDDAQSKISISNKKATCTSIISGKSDITKIYVEQILQKKSGSDWIDHAIWYRTEYSTDLEFNNTSATLNSGTYRVKTVAKVYKGNSYEDIIKYSFEKSL